jgi:arylsulfatase A-like enzyme
MSVISDAIAERQSTIERLQAEIKALGDVEKMLGDSAPQPRRRTRRSSSPRKPAAAAAPAPASPAPEAKPRRKRREMTPEEKKAVSERMTAYWAARRKKSGK